VAHAQLTKTEGQALVRAAQQLHYRNRRWPEVLAALRWSASRKQRFDEFRRAHPQDVKAADARECITAARKLCEIGPPPKPTAMTSLSVWARRAWFEAQGSVPAGDGESGVRSLLIAEWARSLGLEPPPERTAFFEKRAKRLKLDAGVLRTCAEALALEELILRHPELLFAQAPSRTEGRWVDAVRRSRR
jgi:hypothetical protein